MADPAIVVVYDHTTELVQIGTKPRQKVRIHHYFYGGSSVSDVAAFVHALPPNKEFIEIKCV
jgi:hypothetical protein